MWIDYFEFSTTYILTALYYTLLHWIIVKEDGGISIIIGFIFFLLVPLLLVVYPAQVIGKNYTFDVRTLKLIKGKK